MGDIGVSARVILKRILKEIGCLTMDCIHIVHKIVELRTLTDSVMKLQGPLKVGKLLESGYLLAYHEGAS